MGNYSGNSVRIIDTNQNQLTKKLRKTPHMINLIKKHKPILIAILLVSFGFAAFANLKLPSLIGNNMVLQQKEDILLWGWDDAGERIKITTSWDGKTHETITSSDGMWRQVVSTPQAGGPYEIWISDRNFNIHLQNVMIGEVWLCSGQSNMEFKMQDLGVWEAWQSMKKSKFEYFTSPNLRLFTVARDTSENPRDDCKGNWLTTDSASIENFSATAYFFGKYLCENLKIPVGLISAAWGGTPAETWIPIDRIKNNPELESFLKAPNKAQWWSGFPGKTYNGMIKPLVNYKIKGAIWYQGESNVKDYRLYPILMETLISSWRDDWNNPEMPFYYVQIAPFIYENPVTGALLREAQNKCLDIPHTGMAVSLDLVDKMEDIHPKNKWDIGKRLSLLALGKTYIMKNTISEGPKFKKYSIQKNNIVLEFANPENGLQIQENNNTNFLIAGADRIFYPAKAIVKGQNVIVSSSKVSNPQAIRYAFENTSTANLFNNQGLPAGTFRSDSWDIITDKAKLVPIFDSVRGHVTYQLSSKARESDIYYNVDQAPDKQSKLYQSPFEIEKSGTLYARVARDGYFAQETNMWTISKHEALNANVEYTSQYSWYYPSSGAQALVDGILGSTSFNDGQWQGFEGNDVEIVLNFENVKSVKSIQCRFLKDYSSWIFLPNRVKAEVSVDGIKFREVGNKELSNEKNDTSPMLTTLNFEVNNKIRFVRLTAINQKQCPQWHDGNGQKAWIFTDEIIVK